MTADVHNMQLFSNIGSAKTLLHSLVPRAQCFCFYDLERTCRWSSDGVDDFEIDSFIAEMPRELLFGGAREDEYVKRTLTSGRTLLLLPVYASSSEPIGTLVSVFSKNDGKSSWFNPSLLNNILEPAVKVIAEIMLLNAEVSERDQVAANVESELKLIYQIDEKIHSTSRSHSGLAQLIGQSGRFLGISYSVLLLPAKRIRISATHSSWKSVNRKSVDKYLIDTLFSNLDGRRGPIVFDVPKVEGSKNPAEMGYQAMLCPLVDKAGNVEGALAQLGRVDGSPFDASHMRFMTHIVRKVEYVIEQSFDSLTGLMNRGGFEAQLNESMQALDGREDSHQLIYFDLDNLQLVNDTFERKAGDDVITRFGQLIEEHLPKNAVATRLAEDDFVILLTHSTADDALNLATQIKKNTHVLRYLQGDRTLQVTFSAGIAPLHAGISEGDGLTTARVACDSAKDHGRDRIEIYDQNDQSIVRRYDDMYLVAEIQNTLDLDNFRLLAQPIVPLEKDATDEYYEILLRMSDNKGNRVSSSTFFSAAERYQLMPQIDRWVVSNTLARLAENVDYLESSNAVFAINLSGQSLGDDHLLNFIEEEFDRSGVPSTAICFEITESSAVSSHNKAQAFIDALRKRGCKFSLDDFGAGLSSFAYLKNFKVDTLKIDGSFIRDISENQISESMVVAITQVAKVMNLRTVAEYVENQDTKDLLAEIGVDFAQGHAVGRPVPLQDVLAEASNNVHSSTA